MKIVGLAIVGNCWCATINPLGGYFCEIAAALAYLQNIPGVPVDLNWWEDMTKFAYQREKLCKFYAK